VACTLHSHFFPARTLGTNFTKVSTFRKKSKTIEFTENKRGSGRPGQGGGLADPLKFGAEVRNCIGYGDDCYFCVVS